MDSKKDYSIVVTVYNGSCTMKYFHRVFGRGLYELVCCRKGFIDTNLFSETDLKIGEIGLHTAHNLGKEVFLLRILHHHMEHVSNNKCSILSGQPYAD